MLKYNISRILKARGIDRPFGYLTKAGFSKTFASRIRDNRVNRLNNKELEKLCLTLGCTPNDLLEWTPDSKGGNYKDHPMQQLKRKGEVVDLSNTLNSIPLDQMEDIQRMIEDKIEKKSKKKKPPEGKQEGSKSK